MSPRNFPSSNPSTDFDKSIDDLERRIANLEAGRHRAGGSSFGVPFILTNGTITYSIGIDDTFRLVVTSLNTGVVTVIATT